MAIRALLLNGRSRWRLRLKVRRVMLRASRALRRPLARVVVRRLCVRCGNRKLKLFMLIRCRSWRNARSIVLSNILYYCRVLLVFCCRFNNHRFIVLWFRVDALLTCCVFLLVNLFVRLLAVRRRVRATRVRVRMTLSMLMLTVRRPFKVNRNRLCCTVGRNLNRNMRWRRTRLGS